jgi:uncharacterized SAM-binding protein YcdF (DUF218 family)
MFYILSKVLGLFINPIVWIAGSITCLVLFSNKFILNEFLLKWEKMTPADEELLPQYDVGIVLSGMVWYDSQTGNINFLQSSDRIWKAVKLYKENRIKKILISGGDAELFVDGAVEALLLKDFLIKIGIPADDIITEVASRNTYENATFTAKLLEKHPHNNLLLITSAMHMRRAESCFRKAGLNCDIYPVDLYSGSRRFGVEDLLIPNIRTLFNWNAFIHEIFGVVSYKVAGYI